MASYEIGSFLKRMRIQKGLSQSQLAQGIMTPGTLSRIENGHNQPTPETFRLLMERLGLNAERYFSSFLSAGSYEAFTLRTEATNYNRLLDDRNTAKVLAKMETHPEFQEGLNRQFLLHIKASLYEFYGYTPEEVQAMLYEAIKISVPAFCIENIGSYLLSGTDIKILNLMAITSAQSDREDEAIQILYAVKESVESSYGFVTERAWGYPLVLYTLSKHLGLCKRFDEAIKVCDEAVQVCTTHDCLTHLPKILFNKAYCLHKKGHVDECKNLVLQAYWGCHMIGKHKDRDAVQRYAERELGIILV